MTGVVLTMLLAAGPVAPHRVALLVGANEAPAGRTALRWAHRDARELGDALVRVGGVAADDVVYLFDPTPDQLLAALGRLGEALGREAGESMLYFYYSGHADEGALYPKGQALPVERLRAALLAVQATVRLGIIDACSGGGWTRAKGLTAGPPLALAAPLTLATEGTVLLASSSGVESAHESEALHGSFFTHHLVGGLLGAADVSGDGQVTAQEAFQYAQAQTVRESARSAVDPQHPSFEWNLRGRTDLVLARLDASPSLLTVEQAVGPLQVVALPSGLVLLELPSGARQARLAVPPGHYLVRRVDERRVATAREVDVQAGKAVLISEASLELVGQPLSSKGADEDAAWSAPTTLPAHRFGLTARGGATMDLVTRGGGPLGSLEARWAPLDWLELSLLAPGVTFRVGDRRGWEGVFFLGLESVGWSRTNGWYGTAAVAVGARGWANRHLQLLFNAEAALLLFPGTEVGGFFSASLGAGVSVRLGERWSLNVGLGVGARTTFTVPVLGGPRLGNRQLPLVRLQLNDALAFGLDLRLRPTFATTSGALTISSLVGEASLCLDWTF